MIPARRIWWLALVALMITADARADNASLGASNPRALVEQFLARTATDDWSAAAELVERSPRSDAEIERLIRRLSAILDRFPPPELDSISPLAEGDLDDGLAADRELVVPPGHDKEGPGALLLVRVGTADGQRWMISRATVARIDAWYRSLPMRWLVERLPSTFSRPGRFGFAEWQWLVIAGALFMSLLGAFGFGRGSRWLLERLARRTKTETDDLALIRLRGPLVVAWFLLLARMSLPFAALSDHPFGLVKQLMRGALAATMFWLAISSIEAIQVTLAHDSVDRPGRRALLGLGGRMVKMVLAIIAVVVVMAELGFSVTSLIAGIGVGGLGLALAAQKTVENVFGAFSLGVDQPFREGDAIRVEDITGTVESIGLRSTRIRTLDRTVVAIPNGKLAEMKTETLTARDRFRLFARLGLTHDATPAAVQQVLADIEALLKGHEKAGIDAQARMVGLSLTGIELEVSCSFLTTSVDEFSRIRQEMLLAILGIVERADTRWSTAPLAAPATRPS